MPRSKYVVRGFRLPVPSDEKLETSPGNMAVSRIHVEVILFKVLKNRGVGESPNLSLRVKNQKIIAEVLERRLSDLARQVGRIVLYADSYCRKKHFTAEWRIRAHHPQNCPLDEGLVVPISLPDFVEDHAIRLRETMRQGFQLVSDSVVGLTLHDLVHLQLCPKEPVAR